MSISRLRTCVYAVYDPPTIACAAIWLACRDQGVKLPNNWWLLFDTEAADFQVVAAKIRTLYYAKLDRARLPLTPTELEDWLAKQYQE